MSLVKTLQYTKFVTLCNIPPSVEDEVNDLLSNYRKIGPEQINDVLEEQIDSITESILFLSDGYHGTEFYNGLIHKDGKWYSIDFYCEGTFYEIGGFNKEEFLKKYNEIFDKYNDDLEDGDYDKDLEYDNYDEF